MEFIGVFHPKVIHFPIAFLLIYTLLEIVGTLFKKDFFSKAAHLFLFLGVLGAVAALLTGKQAFENFDYWNKQASAIFEEHEKFANITLWYFTALLVLRTYLTVKKKFLGSIQYLIVILAIVGTYFIYETGEYGGQMVYQHGIGTEYKIKIMEE